MDPDPRDARGKRIVRPEEADRLVFQVVRDSKCSECGAEIWKGQMLLMEANQPLCIACAGLAELEFLPSGDAALTRRAAKHSQQKAVVVQFSRTRGRYERQGILVETAALEQAERECDADADERAKERARSAGLRRKQDRELVIRMTNRIQTLFPGCPPDEARAIAGHTARRGSGRVGRTAAGRNLDEDAMTAAIHAAVRHRHTNYDELLARGFDRELAREETRAQVRNILERWRAQKPQGAGSS
jgi:hypothetical protein